jgi:hypothetical protein
LITLAIEALTGNVLAIATFLLAMLAAIAAVAGT